MAKTPESLFTNAEIAGAFSAAAEAAGIVLPDGNGFKIVGKSLKSTWSKKPESFQTDDSPKTTGPYAGNWVLWTPSVDTWGRWNLLPVDNDEDDSPEGAGSALVSITGGSLRPFARAANVSVRDSTAISKDFQAHRERLKLTLAHIISGSSDYHSIHTSDVEDLVVASLPEPQRNDENIARLSAEGAVFLGKVVDLGRNACKTLLESDS